jgi:demethylspheroidene O-methyltransferase
MEAAAALGLVERRSGSRWGLGALGAALLGNPAATAMIAHHPLLYADLQDPVACLRGETGGLSRYWAYARDGAPAGLEGREVGPYTELMAASQPLVARQVLDAVPLRGRRRLMDVGGGSGAFLAEAEARHPGLRLALFDLPPVAAEARTRFERHGFADRAEALGGDFRTDPLPPGADAISLVRVIHDHDDEAALAIMRNARSALEPGGVLILAEPMAGTPGAETVGAYFALYLHAMGSGRPRTAAELTGMLAQAGFARVRRVPTRMPLLCSVLVASAE